MNYQHNFWYTLIIIGLFIVLTGMRLIHIEADPPDRLSWSAAPYTDEGFKTLSARNMVLFGDWKCCESDEYSGWIVNSPVMTYVYVWIYNQLGVSLAISRLLPIILSLLLLLLLFVFALKYLDKKSALLLLVFLGFNYTFIMYNRLAFFETPLMLPFLFVILSLLGLLKVIYNHKIMFTQNGAEDISLNKSNVENPNHFSNKGLIKGIMFWFFIGLVFFIAAAYTKKVVYLWVASLLPGTVMIGYYLLVKNGKIHSDIIMKIGQKLFYILFFVMLGLYIFFTLFDLSEFLFSLLGFQRYFASFPKMISLSIYQEFFLFSPIMNGIAILYGFYSFTKFQDLFQSNGSDKPAFLVFVDVFFAAFYVFGVTLTALFEYHPIRYYLYLYLPQAFLTMRFFMNYSDLVSRFIDSRKPLLLKILFGFFWFYATIYFVIGMIMVITTFDQRLPLVVWVLNMVKSPDRYIIVLMAVFGMLVTTSIFILTIKYRKKFLSINNISRTLGIILVIILVLQVGQYLGFALDPDYTVVNINEKMDMEIPPNSILAGGFAPTLTINTDIKALVLFDSSDSNTNVDNLDLIKPDYLVLANLRLPIHHTLHELKDQLSYLTENADIIIKDYVSFFELSVYRLNWERITIEDKQE